MDKRLVALIQRAVRSDQYLFPLNSGWQRLHLEYNVGATAGNKIRLSRRDKEELIDLVKQTTGLDLRNASIGDFAHASRSEALEQVRNEKWAVRAVSGHRLALKAMPANPLRVNGKALELPQRCHLDIAIESLGSIGHETILVVENYECFDRIDRMRLAQAEEFADSLIVYRGHPHAARADSVKEFIRDLRLPVAAMVDLDPAGLVIAQALPFVAGIVAPDLAVFESLLKRGNPELYHRQRPNSERALAKSPHPIVRDLWRLIERYQAGLVQERWLLGDVQLRIHRF